MFGRRLRELIAVVTIVAAASANPSPQFGVGGWGQTSLENMSAEGSHSCSVYKTDSGSRLTSFPKVHQEG